MNKLMNIKKLILVLSVLFSISAFAEDDDDLSIVQGQGKIRATEAMNKDPNDRNPNGAETLAVGATTSTDSCLCNTVGGTIAAPKSSSSYDHLLATENPKSGTSAPAGGAGAVDGN